MRSSSSLSLVNVRGSTWMRYEKLPMRALSAGSKRVTNCSAASWTRRKLSTMLPLRSSIITTMIGWMSLAKMLMACGLPLSRISKSSRPRSGTSRPSASVTVAYTGTVRVAARKTGSCPCPAALVEDTSDDASSAASVSVSEMRQDGMRLSGLHQDPVAIDPVAPRHQQPHRQPAPGRRHAARRGRAEDAGRVNDDEERDEALQRDAPLWVSSPRGARVDPHAGDQQQRLDGQRGDEGVPHAEAYLRAPLANGERQVRPVGDGVEQPVARGDKRKHNAGPHGRFSQDDVQGTER